MGHTYEDMIQYFNENESPFTASEELLSSVGVAKQALPLPNSYHLITVKKVGKRPYTTREELDRKFDFYMSKSNYPNYARGIWDRAYELDSFNRLHLHAIVYTENKELYVKSMKGWHVDVTSFPDGDLENVRSYIHKQCCQKMYKYHRYELDDILLLNEARNTYLFDDMKIQSFLDFCEGRFGTTRAFDQAKAIRA